MLTADNDLSKAKVNLETSKIPWQELQRFFASGLAIFIDKQLDLVEVACHFADDDKIQVQKWLEEKKIHPVSDDQARFWLEQDSDVWAVVVKPWILVQEV